MLYLHTCNVEGHATHLSTSCVTLHLAVTNELFTWNSCEALLIDQLLIEQEQIYIIHHRGYSTLIMGNALIRRRHPGTCFLGGQLYMYTSKEVMYVYSLKKDFFLQVFLSCAYWPGFSSITCDHWLYNHKPLGVE